MRSRRGSVAWSCWCAPLLLGVVAYVCGCGAKVVVTNAEGGTAPQGTGGAGGAPIEPERCNDSGDISWLFVEPIPAGITTNAIDGHDGTVVLAARLGDRRVLLQRRAVDGAIFGELYGEPVDDCAYPWASGMAVGPSGVTLSGTLHGAYSFGPLATEDDGSGCLGAMHAYVLTTSLELEPVSLSHYMSGTAADVPPVKSDLHEVVAQDGAWLGGWYHSTIDLDGTVLETALEEEAVLFHRTPSGEIDAVGAPPNAFRVFLGGVKDGQIGIRWREKTENGGDVDYHAAWVPGVGPAWTGYGPALPRPRPGGWVTVGPTTELLDEAGEVVASENTFGATVNIRAVDVNASGQIALAGHFEEEAELPGCTLAAVGPLTLFVAVLEADLTLRHARVLGMSRDGPAGTYDHKDIPTNRIRDVYLEDDGAVWVVADIELPVAWAGETIEPTPGSPQCTAAGGTEDECVSYDLAVLRLEP